MRSMNLKLCAQSQRDHLIWDGGSSIYKQWILKFSNPDIFSIPEVTLSIIDRRGFHQFPSVENLKLFCLFYLFLSIIFLVEEEFILFDLFFNLNHRSFRFTFLFDSSRAYRISDTIVNRSYGYI